MNEADERKLIGFEVLTKSAGAVNKTAILYGTHSPTPYIKSFNLDPCISGRL